MYINGSLEIEDILKAQLKNISEAINDVGTVDGAITCSLEDGNVHSMTISGDITLSFTDAPTTGKNGTLSLYITQDETGGHSITCPGSVTWASGSAPALRTTASVTEILSFVTKDGGSTWYGFLTTGIDHNTNRLQDQTDVTISSATDGDLLIYDTSGWKNVAMSGDATITEDGEISVTKIGGKTISLSGEYTLTLTQTDDTTVTMPVSGTLATEEYVNNNGGTPSFSSTVLLNSSTTDDSQNSSGGVEVKRLDDETATDRNIQSITVSTMTLSMAGSGHGIVAADYIQVQNATSGTNNGVYLVESVDGADIVVDDDYSALATDQGSAAGTIAKVINAVMKWDEANKQWVAGTLQSTARVARIVKLDKTSSTTWVLSHNLDNKYVSVKCFNSSDEEVGYDTLTLTDANTSTVTWTNAQAGYAVVVG
jgi:hypothetical protein